MIGSFLWNSSKLIIILIVILFNGSCVTTTVKTDCQNDITDATKIPYTSFMFISVANVHRACLYNETGCESKTMLYHGSGVLIYRSQKDEQKAFIMTAKHLCDKQNEEIQNTRKLLTEIYVVDYYGRKHDAKHVYSSDDSDLCVVSINDLKLDVEVAKLSHMMPNVGEKAYNVAAPRGFFRHGAALIFEGIYSGISSDLALYTIPTTMGSSGSGIFNRHGKLISLTVSIPVKESSNDRSSLTKILESLAVAEPLGKISRVLSIIVKADVSTVKISSQKK